MGQGTSGTVFEGTRSNAGPSSRQGPQQPLEIKRIKRSDFKDVRDNLRRELEISEKVRHPRLLHALDILVTDGETYVVYPQMYMDLDDWCYKRRDSDEATVRRVMQFSNRILHRDLKPQNIMINVRNGNFDVRIGYFGTCQCMNPGKNLVEMRRRNF